MAFRTSEEYVERLSKMKPNVYAHRKRIGRDDPMLEIAINTFQITFDSINDLELKDLIVTHSHLNGEEINRFTALDLSIEDLLLAIYCRKQHNEKVSVKRVRQLRIKIQDETRITNNHIVSPNFESKFENHQISDCYASA